MFFEFVHAVLTFDLNWLAWLLFANFHYLFAFAAIMFFLFEGKTKSVLSAVGIFIILAWAFVDWTVTSGWVFFVGTFLAMNYVTKIAVLSFAEADPKLSKYLIVINFIATYSVLTIYNLFLVR